MILGFVLTSYLKMSVMGVAVIGIVTIMIIYFNDKNKKATTVKTGDVDYDDTDSF